jgi:hypothetical protein
MATNSKNVSKHLVYTGLCKNKGKCRKDPYACYLYREEIEGPVEQQTNTVVTGTGWVESAEGF